MGYRKTKAEILSLLEMRHWPEIAEEILEYRSKESLHSLFSALCSTKERCKWHAVSAFGVIVPELAQRDIEAARVVMRRFLWSLNDESGGIGWGIPEAMGEVMACSLPLFSEYHHMLLSYMREDGPEIFQDGNYLELPALQRGLLWGVGRMLATRGDHLDQNSVASDLRKYLESPDPEVRGLAAWDLGMCGSKEDVELLRELADSTISFSFYWDMMLSKVSVAELADRAVAKIV